MFRAAVARIRSLRDYVTYVGRPQSAIGLAVAGLVLGAATILPSRAAVTLALVGLALSLLALGRDLRHLLSSWQPYEVASVRSDFPVHRVRPPRGYEQSTFFVAPNRGTMLLDATIDEHLRSHRTPAIVEPDRYRLPPTLRSYAPYILGRASHDPSVYNGKALGLRSDLGTGSDVARAVFLRRATFYDSLCSSDLCQFALKNRITGKTLNIRDEELIDPTGRLVSLAGSRLANVVGVSTLVFTADDLLVTVLQKKTNVASQLLVAPSGSGSLEPQDAHGRTNLQDILVAGMERELEEEVGIRADDIERTVVLGFGRWLERGAKPEFFGVTQLRINATELTHRTPSRRDRRYVEMVDPIGLDVFALAYHLSMGGDVLDWPQCPDAVRDFWSLPLIVALRVAAQRLADWK